MNQDRAEKEYLQKIQRIAELKEINKACEHQIVETKKNTEALKDIFYAHARRLGPSFDIKKFLEETEDDGDFSKV